MSFDIFVQDLPQGIRHVDEIPEDFAPGVLGARADLIATIRRAAPGLVFTDAGWGTIEGLGYSVEVNLGASDPVDAFAFHVRGTEEGLFLVADILAALNIRALAPGTATGLFTVDAAAPAYRAWRAYRARVAGLE